jgi:adenine-specific DNA-methyltransferase
MNQINKQSKNLHEESLQKLKELFPNLFSDEGVLNEAELKAMLEGYPSTTVGKYEFNWAGKMSAKRSAYKPSRANLKPDKSKSIDFDSTENLIIEGDNLEVLKLLQKSYANKIKCIYIDPPYNTGHDFVYSDDFSEGKQAYWEKSGVTENGVKLDTNTESQGRYHSNWLNMMYPRLVLARELLKEDGVIFVSIDDNEVHNLRKIMDEVFGEENFVAQFPWRKRTAKSDVPFGVSQDFEWVITYAKNETFNAMIKGKGRNYYESKDLPNRPWRIHGMTTQRTASERPNSNFTIVNPKTGEEYPVNPNAVWRVTKESFQKYLNEKRIVFPGDYTFLNISQPVLRYFKEDDIKKDGTNFGYVAVPTLLPKEVGMTLDGTKEINKLFNQRLFPFPKPSSLIKYLVSMIKVDDNDIILDFFAGSGTTAHAVMDLNKEDSGNRKFILVQIPEATDPKSEAYKVGYKTISDICIERVKRVSEKIKKESEGKLLDENKNLDLGFKVFKLAPSFFPENLFSPDPEKSEEENIEAYNAYLEKAKQQLSFSFDEFELLYEILLKDGFRLTFKAEELKEFGDNKVLKISDGEKEALVCLDTAMADSTLKNLEKYKDSRFICLERAVDTTKKWNLKNIFGENIWVA